MYYELTEDNGVFTAKMDIITPFEFCGKCDYMELAGITLYGDGRPFASLQYCKNSKICEYIVDLYKKTEESNGRFD